MSKFQVLFRGFAQVVVLSDGKKMRLKMDYGNGQSTTLALQSNGVWQSIQEEALVRADEEEE